MYTKTKVLIIDDNLLEATMLVLELRENGYDVCMFAQNAPNAKTLIDEYLPHIILIEELFGNNQQIVIDILQYNSNKNNVPVITLTGKCFVESVITSKEDMVSKKSKDYYFRVMATIDSLLKQFNGHSVACIKKPLHLLEMNIQENGRPRKENHFNNDFKDYNFQEKSIAYIEATTNFSPNSSTIWLYGDKKVCYLDKHSMKERLISLENSFMFIHSSYIVNILLIDSYCLHRHVVIDGKNIPIGRTFWEEVDLMLKEQEIPMIKCNS